MNPLLIHNQFIILLGRKVVVLKLVINLIIGMILEITCHETEEDRHVWMVMQRHQSTFLYEEENQSVVIIIRHIDSDSVQVLLKVIATFWVVESELFRGNFTHLSHHALARWVRHGCVEE